MGIITAEIPIERNNQGGRNIRFGILHYLFGDFFYLGYFAFYKKFFAQYFPNMTECKKRSDLLLKLIKKKQQEMRVIEVWELRVIKGINEVRDCSEFLGGGRGWYFSGKVCM